MDIEEHIPLKEHTTLRLGGEARFFALVHSVEDLRDAVAFAQERDLPVFVLGGGSNILFSDEGWNGMVVRILLRGREYTEDSRGDGRVLAGAGEVWDELVEDTVTQGFWGMENLSHIPGTVGATPVQNIGCYGVSVSEIIDWVEVLDIKTNEMHVLSVGECNFGYRDSIFKHAEGKNYVVTRVAYRLRTQAEPRLGYRDLAEYFAGRTNITPLDIRNALRLIRGRKFPDLAEVGTAGSFFKNPIMVKGLAEELSKWVGEEVPMYVVDGEHVKVPAAWLLEKFGWKGKRRGNVGCWKDQALVLVHYGNGTASEFILFAYDIVQDVKKRTSLKLEPEVIVVGNNATDDG